MTPAITKIYPTMVAVRGPLKKLAKKNPKTTCECPHNKNRIINTTALV